jgi:5-methylcytosine-specific restriction endonuclease McrA
MPRKEPRNYKQEYADYHGTGTQKKNRAARNTARSTMAKDGKVSKGDGKEVDHKKPLSKGGSTKKSNLRVVSKAVNRKKGNRTSGANK